MDCILRLTLRMCCHFSCLINYPKPRFWFLSPSPWLSLFNLTVYWLLHGEMQCTLYWTVAGWRDRVRKKNAKEDTENVQCEALQLLWLISLYLFTSQYAILVSTWRHVTSTDSVFFPEQVIVSSFKHAYNQLDVLVTSIALKFPRPMPSALTNINIFFCWEEKEGSYMSGRILFQSPSLKLMGNFIQKDRRNDITSCIMGPDESV